MVLARRFQIRMCQASFLYQRSVSADAIEEPYHRPLKDLNKWPVEANGVKEVFNGPEFRSIPMTVSAVRLQILFGLKKSGTL
jgi:hypothetical protein